jgi:hypothetical protein
MHQRLTDQSYANALTSGSKLGFFALYARCTPDALRLSCRRAGVRAKHEPALVIGAVKLDSCEVKVSDVHPQTTFYVFNLVQQFNSHHISCRLWMEFGRIFLPFVAFTFRSS